MVARQRVLSAAFIAALLLGPGGWQAEGVVTERGISCEPNLALSADCAGTLSWDDVDNVLTLLLRNTGSGVITSIGIETLGFSVIDDGKTVMPDDWSLGPRGLGAGWDTGAQSNPPPPQTGIQPSEDTTFAWHLDVGDASLTALSFTGEANRTNGCRDANDLAWGCLLVQALVDDLSAKLPLRDRREVPEPGALLLLGAGLVVVGLVGRRGIAGRREASPPRGLSDPWRRRSSVQPEDGGTGWVSAGRGRARPSGGTPRERRVT